MLNFKHWLEASEKDIQTVMAGGLHNNLGRLFKNRLRVVFPLKYNQNDVLEKAVAGQNKYQFDFAKGKAFKVVIDGRGQERKQEVKLTRALNDINPKLVDQYLSSNLSIVVSKHPVDILRMSDFKNMQSCHSKGGSHYHCVFDEISSGGAIAFLVHTSDLNNVNLEDQEIFANPDTGKGKIKPLARIRLRLYTSPKGKEKIIPGPVYGIEQGSKLKKEFLGAVTGYFGSHFDWEKDQLQGGEYADDIPSSYRKMKSVDQPMTLDLRMERQWVYQEICRQNPFLANFLIGLNEWWSQGGDICRVDGNKLYDYFKKVRPEIIEKAFSTKNRQVKTSQKNQSFDYDEPSVSIVSVKHITKLLSDYAQHYISKRLINDKVAKPVQCHRYYTCLLMPKGFSYDSTFVNKISENKFLDYLSYWLMSNIRSEKREPPSRYKR